MDRLGRVQKERGRAGRGERRGDLLAHDPALADARHDDPAGRCARGLHRLHGSVEAFVQAGGKQLHAGFFEDWFDVRPAELFLRGSSAELPAGAVRGAFE